MPTLRLCAFLLAVIPLLVLSGCSNGAADPPPQSLTPEGLTPEGRTPEAIVPVESPQLDNPRVDLQTTLSTIYYTVTGLTTEQIFASIEESGPTDDLGRQGSGLTSVDWEYAWTGDVTPSGACSIRELTISAEVTVELPQHGDDQSLSEVLEDKWQTYANGVAAHEQRHVDIYLNGAETIKAELQSVGVESSCELLTETIDGIWNAAQGRINRFQETFHQDEDIRLAGGRDPLGRQIETNRGELTSLQGQISALDDEIARLRAEIAVFDIEVASIDAQIKQINDQFPSELPETVRQRLEQLIEQSNTLLVVYNQRVEEHNSAIITRAGLSNEYDRLLAVTNQLVDEFNWTR